MNSKRRIIGSILGIVYVIGVTYLIYNIPSTELLIIIGCILYLPIILILIISLQKEETNVSIEDGPCVKEYWPLIEFAKRFDKMKVGKCKNKTTRETFTCCIFIKNGNFTYVYFYKDIGVLTKKEITKRKNELKVGINANDTYYLYAGKESFVQTVNLED